MLQPVPVQDGPDFGGDGFVCVGIVDDFGLIGHNPAELPGGDPADAVAEREADHHQHTAAGDADNGDEHAAPVGLHVPENQADIEALFGRGTGLLLFGRGGRSPLHEGERGLAEQLGAAQIHGQEGDPDRSGDDEPGVKGKETERP